MLIIFFTRERSVCQLIADRLTEKGHLAFVFTNMQKLLKAVESEESQKADLLALDFRIGAQNDPGWTLLAGGSKIPVVYYNDPYSLPGNFAVNWNRRTANKSECAGRNLMPLFRDLESVMMQHDVLPCVSLVCPPQKIVEKEEMRLRQFSPERFREAHAVQPSKFKLLHYFWQNQGRVLDAKSLCLFMWNEYSPQKKETLFSYICYLRKVFQKEGNYCLRILNDGNGYTFRISCPSLRSNQEETASDYILPEAKSRFEFFPG